MRPHLTPHEQAPPLPGPPITTWLPWGGEKLPSAPLLLSRGFVPLVLLPAPLVATCIGCSQPRRELSAGAAAQPGVAHLPPLESPLLLHHLILPGHRVQALPSPQAPSSPLHPLLLSDDHSSEGHPHPLPPPLQAASRPLNANTFRPGQPDTACRRGYEEGERVSSRYFQIIVIASKISKSV